MFSIRDSVEPEDPLEDTDASPSSTHVLVIDASPITFDLPSTTSAPTQPSSTSLTMQKSHIPNAVRVERPKHRTVKNERAGTVDPKEDVWDFSVESPARSPGQSIDDPATKTRNFTTASMQTPTSVRNTRRNSMCSGTEMSRARRNRRCYSVGVLDESPTVPRKRKLMKRIEDSDTEENESGDKEFEGSHQKPVVTSELDDFSQHEGAIGNTIAGSSNPRKRAIAVVIPIKPRQNTRSKVPLQEVPVENISTPDTTSTKVVQQIEPMERSTEHPRCSQGTDLYENNLENVVLAKVLPASHVQSVVHEPIEKMATMTSPPRQMNVASILARSPNRPVYRVGLSKRVNVESLHGYLKRKAL